MIDCYPDYDKEDLKIKINWDNPNPSKIILFSPLITAQKALKIADKYHQKIHEKVISILHKKSNLLYLTFLNYFNIITNIHIFMILQKKSLFNITIL